MKPIQLTETIYSHPSTGRSGSYFTFMVNDEPLQFDTYVNPDAKQYANLLSAATDLLAALEKAVENYGQPGGPWNVPSDPGGWLDMACHAIKRAKGT